ncbi:MAG: MBL fold metallo-hydrolase [Halobacteriota archaeon]
MAIGDIDRVDPARLDGCSYVDTGMYDVANYGAAYLLEGERPALVETGIGTHHERVLDLLSSAGVEREELAFICPTHVHLDHAGGAGFLARECPNATVCVHERGVRHLAEPSRLIAGTKAAVGDQWRFYTEPEPVAPDRLRALVDRDVIDLGDRRLVAVEVPGHASHQHAFHVPEDDAVFTGDAAGLYDPRDGSIHPTSPPPEFDLEQCLDDIDRIRALAPSTLLYTHFGVGDDPALLDRYEVVLTDWVAAVREAVESEADVDSAIDVIVDGHAEVDRWGATKARAETAMNARGVIGYLDR